MKTALEDLLAHALEPLTFDLSDLQLTLSDADLMADLQYGRDDKRDRPDPSNRQQ